MTTGTCTFSMRSRENWSMRVKTENAIFVYGPKTRSVEIHGLNMVKITKNQLSELTRIN